MKLLTKSFIGRNKLASGAISFFVTALISILSLSFYEHQFVRCLWVFGSLLPSCLGFLLKS